MHYHRRFVLAVLRSCAAALLWLSLSPRSIAGDLSELTFVRDAGVAASDEFVEMLGRHLSGDGKSRSMLASEYSPADADVELAQADDDAAFEFPPRTRSLGAGTQSNIALDETQALKKRPGKRPIVVAVGPEALHAVMRSSQKKTVVAVLVSRADVDSVRSADAELYAIVTDQPMQRQLQLIEFAIPKPHRIGLVYPPDAEAQYAAVSVAAKQLGLAVVAKRSDTAADLSSALAKVLPASDVLLLLSDPISLAPGVAQSVLRSAAAARKPVVSSTEALVRAGAVLGVYTTRDQFVEEAADSISLLQRGGRPPAIAMPRRFSVGVNSTVAQALALQVSDQDALQRRLAAAP
jgi:putative ABC transport system substrate-binding protein